MHNGDQMNRVYRILQPIGQGSIGTVYLAYHENLKKYVVMKKICSAKLDPDKYRNEVDILKSLHHRYLPQVYDYVQMDGGIFTVMDYIPGYDLKTYCDYGWQFDEQCLTRWFLQLCDVLDYLHTRQPKILHCDIKPANIMVTDKGDVCLIDFNVSLDEGHSGQLAGLSPAYASPEQLRKAQIARQGKNSSHIRLDERSDIYSVGAVFYELMSRLSPKVRREEGIMLKDMELPYSGAFIRIIDKCMMIDRSRRFKSVVQITRALGHKERWSGQWRRLMAASWILDGAFFLSCLLGICLIIFGWRQIQQDNFFTRYDQYMEQAFVLYEQVQDMDQIGSFMENGLELLNDDGYKPFLDKYPGQKANLLYCIAQAAMAEEDYISAQRYLEAAASCDPENADLFRDLAICEAKCNELAAAQGTLAKAIKLGLPESDAALVYAQMAYLEGDYSKAYLLAVKAAQTIEGAGKTGADSSSSKKASGSIAGDSFLVSQAAVLAVSACDRLGNYSEGFEFTKTMVKNTRGAEKYLWLQKGGELCVMAFEQEGGSQAGGQRGSGTNTQNASGTNGQSHTVDKNSFALEGISCYEQLKSAGCAGLTDLYNLAYLYENTGQLKKCKALLEEMSEEYPENYEITAQLAYIYYRIENDLPLSQRDYLSVARLYEKARELCLAAGGSLERSAQLLQLKEIIEELKAKGWLDVTVHRGAVNSNGLQKMCRLEVAEYVLCRDRYFDCCLYSLHKYEGMADTAKEKA